MGGCRHCSDPCDIYILADGSLRRIAGRRGTRRPLLGVRGNGVALSSQCVVTRKITDLTSEVLVTQQRPKRYTSTHPTASLHNRNECTKKVETGCPSEYAAAGLLWRPCGAQRELCERRAAAGAGPFRLSPSTLNANVQCKTAARMSVNVNASQVNPMRAAAKPRQRTAPTWQASGRLMA